MKRLFAFLLTAVLLCLSLTGCTLESMRKTHLVFDEAGNINLNGQTYIYLQDARDLLDPELDYEQMYYTTDADVPLLLQEMLGASTYLSKDGRFLMLWHSDIYCRSDVYEEIAAKVKNPGELEYFGYYNDARGFVLMNKEDSAWLRSVLEQLEPHSDMLVENQEYMTQLEACSEDLLMRQYVYTVYRSANGYCFERYNDVSGNYEVLVFPQEQEGRLELILQFSTIAER